MSKDCIHELRRLLDDPEEMARAFEECVQEAGYKKIDTKLVKGVVDRREYFAKVRAEWSREEGEKDGFLPVQYKEAVALDAVKLGVTWKSKEVLAPARQKAEQMPLKAALVQSCRELDAFPTDLDLLRLFRCDELEDVVELLALENERRQQENTKKEQQALRASIAKFKPKPPPATPIVKMYQRLAHEDPHSAVAKVLSDVQERFKDKGKAELAAIKEDEFVLVVGIDAETCATDPPIVVTRALPKRGLTSAQDVYEALATAVEHGTFNVLLVCRADGEGKGFDVTEFRHDEDFWRSLSDDLEDDGWTEVG